MTTEIESAVARLKSGQLVGLPTETVYGLAGDATNDQAVHDIFVTKGRPRDHPLIVHLGEASWLQRYCVFSNEAMKREAEALARRFWPGPLTLVLPKAPSIASRVTGGLDTVAVRVPDHPLALAVLRKLDRPLAAPSANRFGSVSPTRKEHVEQEFGDTVMVLDGGPAKVGVESTIVDLSRGPTQVLRYGGVTREELERVLDHAVADPDGTGPRAPGSLPSHYAPRARVVTISESELWQNVQERVARISGDAARSEQRPRLGVISRFEPPRDLPSNVHVVVVGRAPEDMARALYAALRELDDRGCSEIVAVEPPPQGVGRAVADRLARASAERPLDETSRKGKEGAG